MARCFIGGVVLVVALFVAWGATAQTSKGAEQIALDGGTQGKVPFPHLRHQNTLDDCMVCHALFPQENGGIVKAKAGGKLAAKQIMNTHCIQCHRNLKQAGKNSGPITCSKCHVKE